MDSSLMGILLGSFPSFLRSGVSACAALLAKGHCSPHSESLSTVERFSERPSEDQGHPQCTIAKSISTSYVQDLVKWDLFHCNQDGEGPSKIYEWAGWSQGSLAVNAHVKEASDLPRPWA